MKAFCHSEGHPIEFEGFPPDYKYEQVNQILSAYGKLSKTYVRNGSGYAIYKSERSVDVAVAGLNQSPLNLKVWKSTHDALPVTNNNAQMTKNIMMRPGPKYTTVYGQSFETLVDEDNRIYMPMNVPLEMGFVFYNNQHSPPSDQKRTEFQDRELEVFIKMNVYNFIWNRHIFYKNDDAIVNHAIQYGKEYARSAIQSTENSTPPRSSRNNSSINQDGGGSGDASFNNSNNNSFDNGRQPKNSVNNNNMDGGSGSANGNTYHRYGGFDKMNIEKTQREKNNDRSNNRNMDNFEKQLPMQKRMNKRDSPHQNSMVRDQSSSFALNSSSTSTPLGSSSSPKPLMGKLLKFLPNISQENMNTMSGAMRKSTTMNQKGSSSSSAGGGHGNFGKQRNNQGNSPNQNQSNQVQVQAHHQKKLETEFDYSVYRIFSGSYLDEDCPSGVIEYQESLNDNQHLFYIMPDTAVEEMTKLSTIPMTKVLPVAKIGQLVGAIYDHEYIARALIMDINQGSYKCALLDYGLIVDKKEVYDLPEVYYDLYKFGVLGTCPKDDIQIMVKNKEAVLCSWKGGRNEIAINFGDGTQYNLQATDWKPCLNLSPKYEPYRLTEPSLKEGDHVKIIALSNQYLLLRTKKCKNDLIELQEEFTKQSGSVKKIPPKTDYLVTFKTDRGDFMRGIVKSYTTDKVTIYAPDVHQSFTNISPESLTTISKAAKKIPVTCIPVLLEKFTSGFDDSQMEIIQDLIENQSKLVLTKKMTNHNPNTNNQELTVQLSTVDTKKSLTEMLNDPHSYSKIITIKSLTLEEIEVNTKMVMLVLYLNDEFVWLFDIRKSLFADLIKDIEIYANSPHFPTLPYDAKVREIVLGYYQDEETWYRAEVLKKMGTNYDIRFIDFGNESKVTSRELRKLPKSLSEVPILGTKCQLANKNQNTTDVEISSTIEVEILAKKSPDIYLINYIRTVEVS